LLGVPLSQLTWLNLAYYKIKPSSLLTEKHMITPHFSIQS